MFVIWFLVTCCRETQHEKYVHHTVVAVIMKYVPLLICCIFSGPTSLVHSLPRRVEESSSEKNAEAGKVNPVPKKGKKRKQVKDEDDDESDKPDSDRRDDNEDSEDGNDGNGSASGAKKRPASRNQGSMKRPATPKSMKVTKRPAANAGPSESAEVGPGVFNFVSNCIVLI